MRQNNYIQVLSKKLSLPEIGNKASSLLFLQQHHYRIPDTYVLLSSAFEIYSKNQSELPENLEKEIFNLPDRIYAVRSSTNFEDGDNYSYAGQFKTVLNVTGKENILAAVIEVWKSASMNTFDEPGRVPVARNEISCAVILQEMVKAKFSGVSFSKNPVTQAEEVIVEAIAGDGEDLVQKGITPHRWKIKNNTVIEGDENFPGIAVIKEVAADTQILRKKYGKHVDIEWAFDGNHIYYLQLRSITGKSKVSVYSNKMAQEMLPGQIKPLVWSVNIPLVNGTWIKLLSEITGTLAIQPEELSKSFYYRTYFNMAALDNIFREFGLPANSLETMMSGDKSKSGMKFKPGLRTFKHSFRILKFLHSKLNFEKKFLKEFSDLQHQYLSISLNLDTHFSMDNYPLFYSQLFECGGRIAYLNIVVPLLMQFYNKKFARKLRKLHFDYDLINFNADFPELSELSPHKTMNNIKIQFDVLQNTIKSEVKSMSDLINIPEAKNIIEEFNGLLKHFGHHSESGNDFSVPKWEENPELVFSLINQSISVESKRNMISFKELKYSKLKNPFLEKSYQKAGKFKVYREQTSSLYIFGYGLFRKLFLKVGDEFVKKEILNEKSDIFYLKKHEIDDIVEKRASEISKDYKAVVESRKKEMEESKDILLPSVIYGEVAPVIERGKMKNQRGVGTSPGVFKGRARVVKGISDFGLVKKGDVLIIPFSDVSWTPVLMSAGAIVSEAGGMLSHCSIIARELGIPSLVSVENACSIENGLLVTVDGSNGILTIHDNE
ncbi:MAG: PEP/pyruvate-binding domain-containing protein [Bacteroidales bacterium]